jgi:hypothetical protein
MTFQSKSAGDFLDALEQWLWDNNHTSADSRISLANLLSVPVIQHLQRQHAFASRDMLDFLQRHSRRVQVGDAHTKNPWVYSITQIQHRSLKASGVSPEQRTYLAKRLLPEHDVPNSRCSASIILFAPSKSPGCLSVLMAQSKNGKIGFIGAKCQTHEKSLLETAQRGFDECTGGVWQVVDAKGDQHLTPEVAQAASGVHGRVIWNKEAALFLVPVPCLSRDKVSPYELPEQHKRRLQNPAVPQDFKRKQALAWCDLAWNEASKSLTANIPGDHTGLADWTIRDLECEPFKDWFKQNVGLATQMARAQPVVPQPAQAPMHHLPVQPAEVSHSTGAASPEPPPCKFFAAGFCKRGQSCAFKHVVVHSRAPPDPAAPSASSWISDYVSGAKVIFLSIPTYCMKRPKEERLRACDDRLKRLSGILAAVISGCAAAGPEHLADRDKLFTTVSETCLQLQQIADELDRSQERREFVCRCNDLADLCEREKRKALCTNDRAAAAEAPAAQPVCKHSGCLMPSQGKDGLCRMHGG